ncbi:HAD family hydrolase [Pseudomonas sp. GW531-R1]
MQDIAAFGDSYNDLEMLQNAGTSVVVEMVFQPPKRLRIAFVRPTAKMA